MGADTVVSARAAKPYVRIRISQDVEPNGSGSPQLDRLLVRQPLTVDVDVVVDGVAAPRPVRDGHVDAPRSGFFVIVASDRALRIDMNDGVLAFMRTVKEGFPAVATVTTSAAGAYTPAGTRSFALARISLRSEVNSEIVLVATVATGRALRPVASVLDTMTTLSM